MNAMFGSLTSEGLETPTDRVGGYQPFDTNIYTGTIKAAYAGSSDSGAKNVTLLVDLDGREYRETIYVTDRAGKNWFENKSDKTKKVPLPGFTIVDDICLVTTGKPLAEQNTEDKVVKVYDYDSRQEVPKSVPMLVDLLGQQVSLGIVRILENKSKKGDNGQYEAIAETRDVNQIDKVFHTESQRTVAEARDGKDSADFWPKWLERNEGQTRDKRTFKEGGTAGRPGRADPPQAGNRPQTKSLFGN